MLKNRQGAVYTTRSPGSVGGAIERRVQTGAAKRTGGTVKDPKAQFISALLFILTVAAVSCAIINFKQQNVYRLPDDGIMWVDRSARQPSPTIRPPTNKVVALYVLPGSPGNRAGIRSGDVAYRDRRLQDQQGEKRSASAGTNRGLEQDRISHPPERRGSPDAGHHRRIRSPTTPSITNTPSASSTFALGCSCTIAVSMRHGPCISIFCVLRRSFFRRFHFTGKLNLFDQGHLLGQRGGRDSGARRLFLHFCLVYPERRKWFSSRLRVAVLYVPAIACW